MRISDWSSDVCSSDLRPAPAGRGQVQAKARPVAIAPMLDGAAHVARELCDERKAQPPALALGGHEGIEQVAADVGGNAGSIVARSEEHTSELQSLMRISYAVFCLQKTNKYTRYNDQQHT